MTYLRFELLRTVRNVRFFVLSLAFPLVLFYLVAGANRHVRLGGVSFPLYYMVGMATFGAMSAVMSSGGRIAQERFVGWTRQMRITPLSARTYFRAKVVSSYLMACLTLLLLYLAGLTLGVSLAPGDWLQMTGLVLVGLVPFVVLGILLGHLLTPDSIGPALGGGVALFSILGGAFGPIGQKGALHQIVRLIPSYWLVQARDVALGGRVWPAEAWIVILVWTAVLLRLTVRVYQRDTARA